MPSLWDWHEVMCIERAWGSPWHLVTSRQVVEMITVIVDIVTEPPRYGPDCALTTNYPDRQSRVPCRLHHLAHLTPVQPAKNLQPPRPTSGPRTAPLGSSAPPAPGSAPSRSLPPPSPPSQLPPSPPTALPSPARGRLAAPILTHTRVPTPMATSVHPRPCHDRGAGNTAWCLVPVRAEFKFPLCH